MSVIWSSLRGQFLSIRPLVSVASVVLVLSLSACATNPSASNTSAVNGSAASEPVEGAPADSGSAANDSADSEIEEYSGDPKDPFESINRPMWSLTWDYADKYVLKPASQTYVELMNPQIRAGLYNMVLNLNEPSAIINNLLQGNFDDAAKNTGRFVLNSTIGILGLFDVASDFGWMRKQDEFGEVLGYYGVGDGPYLVLPGLGPTSVRAEVGDYIDHYYWPLALIDFWPNVLRMGIVALEKRSELVDQEQLIEDSFDSYEFVKNAYFQNMRYKVYDGDPPIEAIEEFDEDLEEYMDEFDELDEFDEIDEIN